MKSCHVTYISNMSIVRTNKTQLHCIHRHCEHCVNEWNTVTLHTSTLWAWCEGMKRSHVTYINTVNKQKRCYIAYINTVSMVWMNETLSHYLHQHSEHGVNEWKAVTLCTSTLWALCERMKCCHITYISNASIVWTNNEWKTVTFSVSDLVS